MIVAEIDPHIGHANEKPDHGSLPFSEIGEDWFWLKTPVSAIPEKLHSKWEQDLHFLFFNVLGSLDPKTKDEEKVCLCCEVKECVKKQGSTEKRDCEYYGRGICAQATWGATGEEVSLKTLAAFYGYGEDRMNQVRQRVMKNCIEAILKDPVLRDYVEELGIQNGV